MRYIHGVQWKQRYINEKWQVYPAQWDFESQKWSGYNADKGGTADWRKSCAYCHVVGFWFIQGRSDDTLKIAGKRLGPAEVESVLVGHPAVAEAGVIGVPHEVKGESVGCFVVRRPGDAPSEPLRAALSESVAQAMGKASARLCEPPWPRCQDLRHPRRLARGQHLYVPPPR